MLLREEFKTKKAEFALLSLCQRFEHLIILILTARIAVVVVTAIWNLSLKILVGLVLAGGFDPSDYTVFQAVFGMIFTVIIALEFKKSLHDVADRHDNVVRIRSVVLIALLAICRKIIILDPATTDSLHIIVLAAAVLALGFVFWLLIGGQPLGV